VRRTDPDTDGALKLDIERLSAGGMWPRAADTVKPTVATPSVSLPMLC
jgi:hypothetical protein